MKIFLPSVPITINNGNFFMVNMINKRKEVLPDILFPKYIAQAMHIFPLNYEFHFFYTINRITAEPINYHDSCKNIINDIYELFDSINVDFSVRKEKITNESHKLYEMIFDFNKIQFSVLEKK